MFSRRHAAIAGLTMLAVALVLAMWPRYYYDRVWPATLERQLLDAGVVGSSPGEATRLLEALERPRGSQLTVGAFNHSDRVMYASLSNAQRRGWHIWRARVLLAFDQHPRVVSVQVDLTADQPL